MSSLSALTSKSPTIPLSHEIRAAYQDLYDQNEAAIQDHSDNPAITDPLGAAQLNIRNVLTKDNMYKIEQTTALFEALIDQINDTNDELVALKGEITAIASKIATAGTIISAINKVLTLTGV